MDNEIKQNGPVRFYELGHKYVNTKDSSIVYKSVTTLIGEYHESFDSDFWSSYKALEQLMGDSFKRVQRELLDKKKIMFKIGDHVNIEDFIEAKNTILNGYAAKGRESSEYGTKVHKEKEEKFYTGGKINPKDCGFVLHEGNFECERNNYDLNREKAVLPEYLVYFSNKDNNVHLAGQIDLLIKDGNDIYIYDYKTNADGIESKSYYDKFKKQSKKMFYPVNNLDDCKLSHYTLQLSLYAWMLQQLNPELVIKRLCLIHIDRENKETEIDVEYKKDDVKRLLSDYKKRVIITKLKHGK